MIVIDAVVALVVVLVVKVVVLVEVLVRYPEASAVVVVETPEVVVLLQVQGQLQAVRAASAACHQRAVHCGPTVRLELHDVGSSRLCACTL